MDTSLIGQRDGLTDVDIAKIQVCLVPSWQPCKMDFLQAVYGSTEAEDSDSDFNYQDFQRFSPSSPSDHRRPFGPGTAGPHAITAAACQCDPLAVSPWSKSVWGSQRLSHSIALDSSWLHWWRALGEKAEAVEAVEAAKDPGGQARRMECVQ